MFPKPFALHGYRRDQEHDDQGEHTEHDQAGVVERDGAPGRCGAFWNMKYISVMMRLGTTRIIATLR
jgi:hypothetical protein